MGKVIPFHIGYQNVLTAADQKAYDMYAKWCRNMGIKPAPVKTYIQTTAGLGQGIIAWTATR